LKDLRDYAVSNREKAMKLLQGDSGTTAAPAAAPSRLKFNPATGDFE
jgi:hypothetical protein